MLKHEHVFSDPFKAFDGCSRPYIFYQSCIECGLKKQLGYSNDTAPHNYSKGKKVRYQKKLYLKCTCKLCGHIDTTIIKENKKKNRTLLISLTSIMFIIILFLIIGRHSDTPVINNPITTTTEYITESYAYTSSYQETTIDLSKAEEAITDVTEINTTSIFICESEAIQETTVIPVETEPETILVPTTEATTEATIINITEPVSETVFESTAEPIMETLPEATPEISAEFTLDIIIESTITPETETETEKDAEGLYPEVGMIYTGKELEDFINDDYAIYIYINPLENYIITKKSEEVYIPSSDSFICVYEPNDTYIYGFYKF